MQKRRIVIAVAGAAAAALLTGVAVSGAVGGYDVATAPGADTTQTITQPPREDETVPGQAITYTRVQLKVADNDSNQVFGARGYGEIEKSRKVTRVQVDGVRLGVVPGATFPDGIVLTENRVPVNSGTADRATAVSGFADLTQTASGGTCLPGKKRVQLWTRVFYSVRWNDNSLTKTSVLSARSTSFYCTRAS